MLNVPSVSRTTASAWAIAPRPLPLSACRISARVTRSARIAVSRGRPPRTSSVGSDFTSRRTMGDRTCAHATAACSPASTAKAVSPSTRATSGDRSAVARVDPRATVTTKSKAFIFDSVRFPVDRRTTTSPA